MSNARIEDGAINLPCEVCGAEAGTPCAPYCITDPQTPYMLAAIDLSDIDFDAIRAVDREELPTEGR